MTCLHIYTSLWGRKENQTKKPHTTLYRTWALQQGLFFPTLQTKGRGDEKGRERISAGRLKKPLNYWENEFFPGYSSVTLQKQDIKSVAKTFKENILLLKNMWSARPRELSAWLMWWHNSWCNSKRIDNTLPLQNRDYLEDKHLVHRITKQFF